MGNILFILIALWPETKQRADSYKYSYYIVSLTFLGFSALGFAESAT